MNRLRVLIADDHGEVRRMIVRLLSQRFEVAGSVSNGKQLVEAAMTLHPDVIHEPRTAQGTSRLCGPPPVWLFFRDVFRLIHGIFLRFQQLL